MSFFDIAKSGNVSDWESHLLAGNNPNELDSYGTTPLSWIVKMDHIDLFECALQKGADPFFPHRNGGSVFFELISQNKSKFIEALLKNKQYWSESENILSRDSEGNTIFHIALQYGDDILWENIESLIKPDFWELRNEEGLTIFLMAFSSGNVGFISKFLDSNPSLMNQKDKYGRNALHIAAEQNLSEEVEYLIGVGLPLEEKDDQGNTALFLAVANDCIETISVLLDAGCDILIYGENSESITRLMDREKLTHASKLWKKELYKRLKDINFETEKERLLPYLQFLKSEKALLPAEIAQAKLIDYLL
ncbi:MAG: ankyrin repeat domain-containing protein [Leptospira sp.]|nr:ankyrin repeat domain-containing protein [Leptospira sp.]